MKIYMASRTKQPQTADIPGTTECVMRLMMTERFSFSNILKKLNSWVDVECHGYICIYPFNRVPSINSYKSEI